MDNDLKSIIEKIIQFRDARQWGQYHDPKNLSEALGIEAAELQEIFLWKTPEESRNLSQKDTSRVSEEIADIWTSLPPSTIIDPVNISPSLVEIMLIWPGLFVLSLPCVSV